MKCRHGFVSNSSSGNFIVKHIDWENDKVLDKKTIQKLKRFGFKETHYSHASHLDAISYEDDNAWKPSKDKKGKIITLNYGYQVSCNEDEVISFLVKNNIGFIATVHYGHQTWLFHKNDKHVMVFQNYGNQVETYHQDSSWKKIMKEFKVYKSSKSWIRIPIKELINEE